MTTAAPSTTVPENNTRGGSVNTFKPSKSKISQPPRRAKNKTAGSLIDGLVYCRTLAAWQFFSRSSNVPPGIVEAPIRLPSERTCCRSSTRESHRCAAASAQILALRFDRFRSPSRSHQLVIASRIAAAVNATSTYSAVASRAMKSKSACGTARDQSNSPRAKTSTRSTNK